MENAMYSLQLHELILGPGLADLVTNPFVVSNKFLNFCESVESTVSLWGLKLWLEKVEATIT